MKLFTAILYVLIFIPLWIIRSAFGFGRFERRFHNQKSAWDRPVATNKFEKDFTSVSSRAQQND